MLSGHAANGLLRFVALPTQLYAAPTGTGEFGLGPGMYHHFDVAMYVGNLGYRLELEGRASPVVVSTAQEPERGLECETVYGADWLPLTRPSMGMRSPGRKMTVSPRVSYSTAISISRPLRRTRAVLRLSSPKRGWRVARGPSHSVPRRAPG